MVVGLRLELKQSQQLAMTPQLQQAIHLLQLSNLELSSYVEEALDRNPILARETGNDAAGFDAAIEQKGTVRTETDAVSFADPREAAESFDGGTENLYDTAPGDPATRLPGEASHWTAGRQTSPLNQIGSSQELSDETLGIEAHLGRQIALASAPEATKRVALTLTALLDDHGYLREPLARIATHLDIDLSHVELALELLQDCEPTGVGARSVSECFALQLKERDRLDPAMRTLIENLNLLADGKLTRLRKLCAVDADDFDEMLAELRTLDPRPCAGFSIKPAETLIPDVFAQRNRDGTWLVELNDETLPKLLIDRRYARQLAQGDKKAKAFVSELQADARWLIKALDQRAQTLLSVSTEIVQRQTAFFDQGVSALAPMTLKDVAEQIGVHESTVSRVTTNKYLSTKQGVFELKFFFTNAVGGAEKGQGPSSTAVRHRIKLLVAEETANSVLSDEDIVAGLREEGLEIARRTVAKYRNSLKIPSSSERKRRLSAIGSR